MQKKKSNPTTDAHTEQFHNRFSTTMDAEGPSKSLSHWIEPALNISIKHEHICNAPRFFSGSSGSSKSGSLSPSPSVSSGVSSTSAAASFATPRDTNLSMDCDIKRKIRQTICKKMPKKCKICKKNHWLLDMQKNAKKMHLHFFPPPATNGHDSHSKRRFLDINVKRLTKGKQWDSSAWASPLFRSQVAAVSLVVHGPSPAGFSRGRLHHACICTTQSQSPPYPPSRL